MKHSLIAVAFIFNVGLAFAEDAPPVAQPTFRVALTQIKHSVGADIKIAPNDYPNGVFCEYEAVVKPQQGTRRIANSAVSLKL